MRRAVALITFLALMGVISGRAFAGETNYFESGVDFPAPYVDEEALAGQEGWTSALTYSTNAARIVSYAMGQALEIFGPFVETAGAGFYDSEFTHSLTNYNPVAEGTPIVSVCADMWMNLGPTASQSSALSALLILNDQNGTAFESIGISNTGSVFGQNFASPNQILAATNTCTNTFHVLRADLDFTNRQVTFFVDGTAFGSLPFNPGSSTLLGSVALALQSTNPIDSNLLLDNLSVNVGTGVPAGACSLKITSVVPCLAGGVAGTPSVGDTSYGLKVTFNNTGTTSQRFRVKFTIANVTYFTGFDYSPLTGSGYYIFINLHANLDGSLPYSVMLDPDGFSGSTNGANMNAGGTFTPTPPSVPLELYDPATMGGLEELIVTNLPGSETMPRFSMLFGCPMTHGAQTVISVTPPPNATNIVSAPYGIPVYLVTLTNVPDGTFQQDEAVTVQASSMRVDPALLETNTWAQLSALPASITQWLAPDAISQSTSPVITNFINSYLPANYKTTMTPYDTARVLHGAVMRSLVYFHPPPYPDATNSLQAGLADCGGYSALLTAAMRQVGIPARRISGFWISDDWKESTQWHVRTEYYLPNTGWLITDSCIGGEADPTGTYSWDFSYVPDANEYFSIDIGDAHIIPSQGYTFEELESPYYWASSGSPSLSTEPLSYLQPLSTACVSNVIGGVVNLSVTNMPEIGTVYLQSSANLKTWSSVATNTATGTNWSCSLPVASAPGTFFRTTQVP